MKIEWWELISKAVWWGWIKVWQIRSARTSMSVVLFTYVTCNVWFFLKVLPPFVFPYLSVFVLIYFYPRTCPVQTKAWSSILPLISQGNRMPLFFIHARTPCRRACQEPAYVNIQSLILYSSDSVLNQTSFTYTSLWLVRFTSLTQLQGIRAVC